MTTAAGATAAFAIRGQTFIFALRLTELSQKRTRIENYQLKNENCQNRGATCITSTVFNFQFSMDNSQSVSNVGLVIFPLFFPNLHPHDDQSDKDHTQDDKVPNRHRSSSLTSDERVKKQHSYTHQMTGRFEPADHLRWGIGKCCTVPSIQ
jgi:hypothetical protein